MFPAGRKSQRWTGSNPIATQDATFDYIIVGAGSAGCVLANRLSESGKHTVLLLEAGPPDRNPWIHIPLGYAKLFTDAAVNWLYESQPNPGHVDRPVQQPRGKTLGGTSSINGMLYVRGQPSDYDHWRQLGNTGWSFDDVLPYFIKAEDQERGGDEFHGVGGPLAVSNPYARHPVADALVESAVDQGFSRNHDFNGAEQEGFGYYQWTIRNGRRCSTAVGYLKPARRRPNLSIETDALSQRILFEGKRAVGVEFQRHGTVRTARANIEVIVSGGAFNSPQLLQLSGLGPADLLKSHGIDVVADMPGVGAELQDHYNGPLLFRLKKHISANDVANSLTRRIFTAAEYAATRKGYLAMATAFSGGFLKVDPAAATPDIQAIFMAFSTYDIGTEPDKFPGVQIVCTLLRPESRGYVRIASADPYHAPEIQPRYLTEQKDRDVLVAGLRTIREITRQSKFQEHVAEELAPGPSRESDDEILEHLYERGRISYHPVGTCRMGSAESGAVVDDRLRVHGIAGLRVVDASIMPTLVSGNTNAPTIMIGEKASDMILADAPS